MGYLNNSSITVDAILTKKGRELLAQGANAFQITQFALADDEIDYSLWNTDHPLGTAYYGATIENMPLTEAVPDETQVMKYKLVTLSGRRISKIPIIDLGVTETQVFKSPRVLKVTPQVLNAQGDKFNEFYGYSAILSSDDLGIISAATPTPAQKQGQDSAQTVSPQANPTEGDKTVTVTGMTFEFRPALSEIRAKQGTITIVANETGAQSVIYLDIRRQDQAFAPGGSITD